MYTIRSKDGTKAVFYTPSEYMALNVADANDGFKLYRADERAKAETIWMCFGGEHGDFEIVEE